MGLTYWWTSSSFPPDIHPDLPKDMEDSPVNLLRFESSLDGNVHVAEQSNEYLDLIYSLCGKVFDILTISEVKPIMIPSDLDAEKFCRECGVSAEYLFWLNANHHL